MNDQSINDRLRTVCFTGHRVIPEKDYTRVVETVDTLIAAAVSNGYRHFVTGGAVGFDTVAACRVIVAKKRLKDIQLHLELPCLNQTENWTDLESIRLYKAILSEADSVNHVTNFYNSTCMHERNRRMVDRSALCIAYCARQKGGTSYTVKYAKKSGLGVINIADIEPCTTEFTKFRDSLAEQCAIDT